VSIETHVVTTGLNIGNIGGELAKLGSKIDGSPVIFVIAGRAITGTANSVYTSANLILRS
jgi:hypothetical protein